MGEEAFDAWLHQISPESFDEGAFIPDGWLRWLHGVYEREGPLTRDDVEARTTQDLRTAADEGLRRVLDDVERLHGSRPEIALVDHDGLRVAYPVGGSVAVEPPEGITTPSHSEATVAVAEVVLLLLADEASSSQFVCEKHGLRLRPRLIDHSAVWSCESGPHPVAKIGDLTPDAGG